MRVLSPSENGSGYLQVVLHKNGRMKTFKVHRLVAEAFIPNWFDEPQVNHKDENKMNNFVGTPENDFNDGNLEWCSAKYNHDYGSHNQRVAEKNTNGKLSKIVLQFYKTGELVREFPSINEAGRNGFSIGHISSCCSGERKSHKGYIWKYK